MRLSTSASVERKWEGWNLNFLQRASATKMGPLIAISAPTESLNQQVMVSTTIVRTIPAQLKKTTKVKQYSNAQRHKTISTTPWMEELSLSTRMATDTKDSSLRERDKAEDSSSSQDYSQVRKPIDTLSLRKIRWEPIRHWLSSTRQNRTRSLKLQWTQVWKQRKAESKIFQKHTVCTTFWRELTTAVS